MTTDLAGKTALVTGSARGIGRAIATTLAARGAHVVAHHRTDADTSLIDAVRATGGQATLVAADLEHDDAPGRLAAATTAALAGGRLDILVHNAGIIDYGGLEAASAATFDRQFRVNVRAPLLLTQALAPTLADGGRVIFLATAVTRTYFPNVLAYAMSKGANDVAIRHLAAELGPRGITVNGVAPGATQTDMAEWMNSDEGAAQVLGIQALQRLAQPQDIADVVAFLASDDARWVTGQIVEASGGLKL